LGDEANSQTRLTRRWAVVAALLSSSSLLSAGAAHAQAIKTIPTIPSRYADDLAAWETGIWSRYVPPDCLAAYWGCFESQEAYNAGESPKLAIPLNADAAAANQVIVDSLGEGKPLFDPDSQCFPQGMPNIARNSFKLVTQPDRYYLILSGDEFRTIWMDGRPMPVREPHEYTYNGDSIGRWENGSLIVETRNITGMNTAIAPNIPKSDNIWVIERYTPVSKDLINLTVTFKDEDRFTEPFTESFELRRDPNADTPPQPMACIPGVGQRYQRNPETGVLELSGPGMVPLEMAED